MKNRMCKRALIMLGIQVTVRQSSTLRLNASEQLYWIILIGKRINLHLSPDEKWVKSAHSKLHVKKQTPIFTSHVKFSRSGLVKYRGNNSVETECNTWPACKLRWNDEIYSRKSHILRPVYTCDFWCDFGYQTRLTLPCTNVFFFAKHRVDWKERYQILFEDTLLSNFC